MSAFKHPYTCPAIDDAIRLTKEGVEEELMDMLGNITKYESIDELVKVYSAVIYDIVEDQFEAVRKTNEEIRDSAEDQIQRIAEEMADMESDLRAEISELRCEIEYLENELANVTEIE